VALLGRRTMQPKLRRHRKVADSVGVAHLVRRIRNVQQCLEKLVIVGACPVHYRQACGQAPARIQLVSHLDIKKIDVIHDLGLLGFALGLLRSSNKMAERMLITVAR